MTSARLGTIGFSHYCERGRWALDLSGLAYSEWRSVPMLHVLMYRTLQAVYGSPAAETEAGLARVSSGASTPVLFVKEGSTVRKLQDSMTILRWADARGAARGGGAAPPPLLPPAGTPERAEVERWCVTFHDRLGPTARAYAYAYTLPSLRLFGATVFRNAHGVMGVVQAILCVLFWPLLVPLLKKAFGINAARTARRGDDLRALFAEVSEALTAGGESRRYLVGVTFTAADLTFAALAAPLLGLRPSSGCPVWYPAASSVSDAKTRALLEGLAATPAGQHAARMYREHRRAR